MWKRYLLAALTTVMLAGCGRSRTNTLVVGICDPLAVETASECVRSAAVRDYTAFARRLAEGTGLDVQLNYYAFDPLLEQAIRSGEVNVAVGKTWSIVEASQGLEHPFVRLADLTGESGHNGLAGMFIARADRGISGIAALMGRKVAIGPDTAYEKSYAARRALAEAGVDPADYRVVDGCVATAAAVLGGDVDAGVVSSYVVEFGGLRHIDRDRKLKVIGNTEAIPFMTIAVSTSVDETTRAKLRETLLGISGDDIPEGLFSMGFVEPEAWEPALPSVPGATEG
ncbi:MAG TPA: PhnD/SsuA/transferrin family substrate-binding protein, partial [Planctomycetota bacterium]|nr:PhnD/SsuA/transferrin family substrate-binding protein [Planctomycetota bacterium]